MLFSLVHEPVLSTIIKLREEIAKHFIFSTTVQIQYKEIAKHSNSVQVEMKMWALNTYEMLPL